MNTIPEWLKHNEEYRAPSDRDGFLTRSLLSLFGVLHAFRRTPSAQSDTSGKQSSAGISAALARLADAFPAPLKLLICLTLIITTSCARNMLIAYIILAVVLVHLCLLPGDSLVRIVSTAAAATAVSALILLPAVFLGSPQSMLTISVKVFISVSLVGILAATTEWNRLTAGLATFHVPDIFIFTLDITLKYIVILGDISIDMLNALKLRSIGRNTTKAASLSGILGVTFLKSRHMADEMYGAMVCRGCDGTYAKSKKR